MNEGKNMKKIISALMILCIIALSGCSNEPDMTNQISDSQFLLGTVITVQIYGTDDPELLTKSFDIIKGVDQWMSLNIDTSEVSQLNANAGNGPIKVSDELAYVLGVALKYGDLSDGYFDVSLEPVIKLWGIGTDNPRIPSEEELSEALQYVNYKNIVFDAQNQTVELQKGMAIDLGGIGKGYAADLVKDYLKSQGIVKAIINLGGNVDVIGEKAEGTPFKVGLQNPFAERNAYIGYVQVVDKTVVTSGVYERNFTENGVTYHHILDHVTGYPVMNGVSGVSVVTSRSIDADALSTTLFTLGVEDGLALANSLEDVECLYIMDDSTVYMTEGMKSMFTQTDTTFSIKE